MVLFPWKKLRLVIAASRRMRQRYRKRLCQIERGWRERHRRDRVALQQDFNQQAKRLQTLITRASRFHAGWVYDKSSREFGITLRWPGEFLFQMYQPTDHNQLRELMSRQLAMQVEEYLHSMDLGRLKEVELVERGDRIRRNNLYADVPIRP